MLMFGVENKAYLASLRVMQMPDKYHFNSTNSILQII